MADKQLAEIRKHDADYKSISSHWQAQVDRRYLLDLIAKIDKIQQEWWDCDIEMNAALSEIRSVMGGN